MHGVFEHLLDRPQPPVGRVARQTDAETIPVHHAAHLLRRQKHTLFPSFDAQEAIAGTVRTDLPLDEIPGVHAAALVSVPV